MIREGRESSDSIEKQQFDARCAAGEYREVRAAGLQRSTQRTALSGRQLCDYIFYLNLFLVEHACNG